jgi:hypothetical protein
MESVTHAALVDELAILLTEIHLAVTAQDRPGCRQPRSFSGYRPDLIAEHLGVRTRVIGEAKIGPELMSRRSVRQLVAFGQALVPGPKPVGAVLILAVPTPYMSQARQVARLVGVSGRTFVFGRVEKDSWQITHPETVTATAWQLTEPQTSSPHCLSVEDFIPEALELPPSAVKPGLLGVPG